MQPNYYIAKGRKDVFEIRWTVREDGRSQTHSRSTGTTDRFEALQVLEGFKRQSEVISQESQSPLLNLILTRYSESLTDSADSGTTKICIRHLIKYVGHYRLCNIDEEVLRDYTQNRGVAPPTIRREFNALKAAINRYVKYSKGALTDADKPIIDLPAQSQPRQVFLDKTEMQAFVEEVSKRSAGGQLDRLHIFVMLALYCGQRATATRNLKWSQVNFTTGLIDFRTQGERLTKKRKSVVPMNATLRAFLEVAKEQAQTDYVCIHNGLIDKTYKRWVSTTDFAHARIHDLRRSFITNLIAGGASVPTVSALVNESPETLLRTYACYVPGAANDAVGLLD
jgi:integrase